MTQQEPKEIGSYEVVGRAGRGGMGDVFLARDPKLGRLVAIKRLPPAKVEDKRAIKRFLREAQVLATLDHANIARIFSLDEDEAGRLHIVLEYVEGETLRDVLRRGPLPVTQAMRATASVADALAAAHRHGVVHRDIKPSNVMIDRYGHTRLLDFGLAKLFVQSDSDDHEPPRVDNADVDETLTFVTEVGALVGTVGYMSPEQVCGEEINERSDIFSLACVVFEMLAGERPFTGPDKKRVMSATLTREPAWERLPSDLPPRFVDVLRQGMVKDSTVRLADVTAIRDAAEAVMHGTWSAAPVSPADRSSDSASGSAEPTPLLRSANVRRAPQITPGDFYSVADDEPDMDHAGFLCHACGRRHQWLRQQVGEEFFCTCGTKLTVPDLDLDGLRKEDRRWYEAVAASTHQPEFDTTAEASAESFGPRRVTKRWLASPQSPLPDEGALPGDAPPVARAAAARHGSSGSLVTVGIAAAAVAISFFAVIMAVMNASRNWQIGAGVLGFAAVIWFIVAVRAWCGGRTLLRAFLSDIG